MNKAHRLTSNGDWEECKVDQIQRGDIVVLYHDDGEVVTCPDGSLVHVIQEPPTQLREDRWHAGAYSAQSIAKVDREIVALYTEKVKP